VPNTLCANNIIDRQKEEIMSKQKVTILYERLSRDDELQGTSNSILNQRQLLEEYAERNNLTPFIHIADDGFSGTNWDRPGWQELMTKIDNDEVSALVVKDSSRIGRDYLRVGLYREMFHEKGIRLIAVNDGIDTLHGEDDFTPFREIMSEWYAKDVSKKIRSVLGAKGRDGKPLSNVPPYGFIKDPNNKNKWIVDEPAAEIVRRIFRLTIEGKGAYQIATILFEEKVERPSYYLTKKGLGNHQADCDMENPYAWRGTTVTALIARPEYAGHIVNFRTIKPSFKSRKVKMADKENWLIFENVHTAIVDQQTWDLAQKLTETKRRINKNTGVANPLTGLIFCADCGAKMYNKRKSDTTIRIDKRTGNEYKRNPTDSYYCSGCVLNRQKQIKICSEHYITTSTVHQIILDILKRTSGFIREHEQEFIEQVRSFSADTQSKTVKAHKSRITKNERRLAEINRLFKSLYEDKVKGLISEEKFTEMSADYEQEQAELKSENAVMQSELDMLNADSENAEKFVKLVKKYTDFETLTGTMINEFIEKIYVHERIWSDGVNPETNRPWGERTQQVDVHLRYVGMFDVPVEEKEMSEEEIKEMKIRISKRDYMRKVYAKERAEKATAVV